MIGGVCFCLSVCRVCLHTCMSAASLLVASPSRGALFCFFSQNCGFRILQDEECNPVEIVDLLRHRLRRRHGRLWHFERCGCRGRSMDFGIGNFRSAQYPRRLGGARRTFEISSNAFDAIVQWSSWRLLFRVSREAPRFDLAFGSCRVWFRPVCPSRTSRVA